MKIIGITNNYGTGESTNSSPSVYIVPDSAILKDGKPFFIPDFSEKFIFYPSLIIRINRLGKNISHDFAHRYYDNVTLGITIHAENIDNYLSGAGLQNSIANAFDGSAILGEFRKIDNFDDIHNLKLTTFIDGKKVSEFNTRQMIININSLIEYLSRYFTLKIGDLIYTGFPYESKQIIEFNQHITASINDIEVLNFKTK